MFAIIAHWQGQLVPTGEEFLTPQSAIEEIKRYWSEGEGHEYFVVQDTRTGEIVAQVARPPQGQRREGVIRFPNGLQQNFVVESLELVY